MSQLLLVPTYDEIQTTPIEPDLIGDLVLWLRADSNIFKADGTQSSVATDSIGSAHGTLTNFTNQEKLDAWDVDVDFPFVLRNVTRYNIDFPGVDALINIGSLNLGTTHTITWWQKGSMDGTVIMGGDANTLVATLFLGTWAYVVGAGNIANVAMTENTNWNHMALVRSGTSVSFYMNNSQVGTTQTLGANTALTIDTIGNQNIATVGYTGKIADVQIYSTTLNAGQRTEVYNGGTATGATIIHRWLFDSGHPYSSAGDNDTVVRITDKTLNAFLFRQPRLSVNPTLRLAEVNGKAIIEQLLGDHLCCYEEVTTSIKGAVSIVFKSPSSFGRDRVLLSSSDNTTEDNFGQVGIDKIGRIFFETNNNGTLNRATGNTYLNTSAWYHVIVNHTDTSVSIMLNGHNESITLSSGQPDWFGDIANRNVMSIGNLHSIDEDESRDWQTNFFEGMIAEVHIYEKSLTSNEKIGLWLEMVDYYGLLAITTPTLIWSNGRYYRRKLTLNLVETVTLPEGTQVEVIINSGNVPDLFVVDPTGNSVLFEEADGTNLSFYNVLWDNTNKRAVYVVKTPEQIGPTTTDVYIYYGMSGASSVSSYNDTMTKLNVDGDTLALWHFDEGTESSLLDETSTYTATITGGTWLGSDGGNFANSNPIISFEGGDCVVLGNNKYITIDTLFDVIPAAWTVEFWLYLNSASAGTNIFTKSANEAGGAEEKIILKWDNDHKLNLILTTAGATTTIAPDARIWPITWTINKWYHIAVTKGPAGNLVWVNAIPALYNKTPISVTGGSARDFIINANNVGGTPTGFSTISIDEFIVRDRQSTYSEIVRDFNRMQYTVGQKSIQDRFPESVNNPIIKGDLYGIDDHVAEPVVRKIGATFNVWVTGAIATVEGIYRFTSANGETGWTNQGKILGGFVGGEGSTAAGHFILEDGATWYHFYRTAFPNANINVATSADQGQTLTKQRTVIPYNAQDWISSAGCAEVIIEKIGHLYRGSFSAATNGDADWVVGKMYSYHPLGPWMLDPNNDYAQLLGSNTFSKRVADNQYYHMAGKDPVGFNLPVLGFIRYNLGLDDEDIIEPFDFLLRPILEDAFVDIGEIQDQSGIDCEFWTDGTECRMYYTVGSNLGAGYFLRAYLLKFAGDVDDLFSLPLFDTRELAT